MKPSTSSLGPSASEGAKRALHVSPPQHFHPCLLAPWALSHLHAATWSAGLRLHSMSPLGRCGGGQDTPSDGPIWDRQPVLLAYGNRGSVTHLPWALLGSWLRRPCSPSSKPSTVFPLGPPPVRARIAPSTSHRHSPLFPWFHKSATPGQAADFASKRRCRLLTALTAIPALPCLAQCIGDVHSAETVATAGWTLYTCSPLQYYGAP